MRLQTSLDSPLMQVTYAQHVHHPIPTLARSLRQRANRAVRRVRTTVLFRLNRNPRSRPCPHPNRNPCRCESENVSPTRPSKKVAVRRYPPSWSSTLHTPHNVAYLSRSRGHRHPHPFSSAFAHPDISPASQPHSASTHTVPILLSQLPHPSLPHSRHSPVRPHHLPQPFLCPSLWLETNGSPPVSRHRPPAPWHRPRHTIPHLPVSPVAFPCRDVRIR